MIKNFWETAEGHFYNSTDTLSVEYECMECGGHCWGPMRFNVDKWQSRCPLCGTEDFLFMKPTGETVKRHMDKKTAAVQKALDDAVFEAKHLERYERLKSAAMEIEGIAISEKMCAAEDPAADYDKADKAWADCCGAFLFITDYAEKTAKQARKKVLNLLDVAGGSPEDYDIDADDLKPENFRMQDFKKMVDKIAGYFGFGIEW